MSSGKLLMSIYEAVKLHLVEWQHIESVRLIVETILELIWNVNKYGKETGGKLIYFYEFR